MKAPAQSLPELRTRLQHAIVKVNLKVQRARACPSCNQIQSLDYKEGYLNGLLDVLKAIPPQEPY